MGKNSKIPKVHSSAPTQADQPRKAELGTDGRAEGGAQVGHLERQARGRHEPRAARDGRRLRRVEAGRRHGHVRRCSGVIYICSGVLVYIYIVSVKIRIYVFASPFDLDCLILKTCAIYAASFIGVFDSPQSSIPISPTSLVLVYY